MHGGNLRRLALDAGRPPEEIVDFSASLNPLGPPEWLPAVVRGQLGAAAHYPDPHSAAFVEAAARRLGVNRDEILAGNGSAELLRFAPMALDVDRAIIPVPSYGDYRTCAELAGLSVRTLPLRSENGFALDLAELEALLRGNEVVLLGQPNNPTGLACDASKLRALAGRWPSAAFIVDEAFADFLEGDKQESLVRERPANVVVVRSLTKFYAIPGLRIGYAVADRKLVVRVRRIMPPWSVNVFAQAAGVAALNDRSDYALRTRVLVAEQRERLVRRLNGIGGMIAIPGRANFLLVRLIRSDLDAFELARRTLRQGVAIRVCADFEGLDDRAFRVAVRSGKENDLLCDALRRALDQAVTKSVHQAPAAPR